MSFGGSTIENAITTWIKSATGLAGGKVIWAGQGGNRPAPPYISIEEINVLGRGLDWHTNTDNLLTLDDDDVDTVDFGNNELDLTAHAYETGDGPIQLTTTGTIPTGLALLTDYWIVVVNAGTIQLASTFANAINVSPTVVSFSDAGSGTHTIEDTATTTRAAAEITHTIEGPREVTLSVQCFAVDKLGDASAHTILNKVVPSIQLPTIADAVGIAGFSLLRSEPIIGISVAIGGDTLEPRAAQTLTLLIGSSVSETGTFVESVVRDPTIT